MIKPVRGFVYLILSKRGVYKIGASTDPVRRLHTLRNKYPSKDLSLIHTVLSSDYMQAEKYFHKFFDDAHIIGEWFALNEDEVNHFKGL